MKQGIDTPVTAQDSHDRYRNVKFFGSLNGLRCLCILAVMWHHSPASGSLGDPFILFDRGFLGVDFFFVLSGFLITTLLLREEACNGAFSLKEFYRRRALRIVPIYFLVVTVMSLYWVWFKDMEHLAPLVPYYYLFLSNMLVDDIPLLSITWSLAVEEQYYILWPLLLLFLPVQIRVVALVVLIALCVLSAACLLAWMGIQHIHTEYAVWGVPVSGFAAILLGTLSAILLHKPTSFTWLYRLFGFRAAPLVAFAVLIAMLSVLPGRLTGFPNLVVHLCMAVTLITLVIREDHFLSIPLQWRPVARVGEISYGLYLYHLIGLHFGVEIGGRLSLSSAVEPYAITAIFVAISLLIAEVSFRTFERFFLDLRYQRNPES